MTGAPSSNASDGRMIALSALENAASHMVGKERLAEVTLQRVIDIAWRHQFTPSDRGRARSELREALKPEIERRIGERQ